MQATEPIWVATLEESDVVDFQAACLGWRHGLGRLRGENRLRWFFCQESNPKLARAHYDYARQLYEELGRQTPSLCQNMEVVLGHPRQLIQGKETQPGRLDAANACMILCDALEGEEVVAFFNRVGHAADDLVYPLLFDVLETLGQLLYTPQILAHFQPEQFRVVVQEGILLRAEPIVALSLIKRHPVPHVETNKTWLDFFGRCLAWLHAQLPSVPETGDLQHLKLFRPFKKLVAQQDRISEIDCFQQLHDLLRLEVTERYPSGLNQHHRLMAAATIPQKPSVRYFENALTQWLPTNPSGLANRWRRSAHLSPYVVDCVAIRKDFTKETRLGFLLPPATWLDEDMMCPVVTKFANTEKRQHPLGLKTQHLYAGETLGVLAGADHPGLPLCSLAAWYGTLKPETAIPLIREAVPALEAFPHLLDAEHPKSLWQLELHTCGQQRMSQIHEWYAMLSWSHEDWPKWQIKVRSEMPMEYFLDPWEAAWRCVLERCRYKLLPALAAWLLEREHFIWAWRHGSLKDEPLSWSDDLNRLIVNAVENIDFERSGQCQEFLFQLETFFDLPLSTETAPPSPRPSPRRLRAKVNRRRS